VAPEGEQEVLLFVFDVLLHEPSQTVERFGERFPFMRRDVVDLLLHS
jgi:hypothetical protein